MRFGSYNGASITFRIEAKRGDYFPQTELPRTYPNDAQLDYLRIADNPPGISVSLQVEHKQFIGNGHLIGSSLR